MGPQTVRLFFAVGLALAILIPLAACGGDPPQIVDYSPQRNTVDVSTAAPIRITFDHDVDRASVESRLHLSPPATGSVRWISGRQLFYDHTTLRTSTAYEVILEPGYRDPTGNTYTLRHHWRFTTESPPALFGSSPANGDVDVDPSAYLTLDFTRGMNPATLQSALSFSPAVPFDVRLDPADARRAVVAPSQLLSANTNYQLLLNTAALDVDGNQLGRAQLVKFITGALHPLRHWVAFATETADGTPGGLWIVNERGFPRELFNTSAVRAYSWSPGGESLLIQGPDEVWWQFTPGAGATQLPFKAPWAASLASGLGFLYIDDRSTLRRQDTSGNDETIAPDIAEAAVAPNGLRIAFIKATTNVNEIWGYDVGLRARYELAVDSGPVSSVAWAPAGNRIAYLRHDLTSSSLRVRNLIGAAATNTLVSGDIGRPAWLPDSTHLVFSAALATPTGDVRKAFLINVVSPPAAISLALGLPSDPTIEVSSPVSSPDGHQIAFLSANQVWLMNADGTRPTALTRQDPATFPYSCRAVAWTPS
ncbi:MAG TPA: Ig-like domain-containing protein [Candidatus Dormibacteraeota bacterium]|nr:Ig-like domain-containing protein [Candidatus Dormibacteraeota bacterium]